MASPPLPEDTASASAARRTLAYPDETLILFAVDAADVAVDATAAAAVAVAVVDDCRPSFCFCT